MGQWIRAFISHLS